MKLGRHTSLRDGSYPGFKYQGTCVAGKVIWDCINGTKHSLPTGIFSVDLCKHLNHFQITSQKRYLCLKI